MQVISCVGCVSCVVATWPGDVTLWSLCALLLTFSLGLLWNSSDRTTCLLDLGPGLPDTIYPPRTSAMSGNEEGRSPVHADRAPSDVRITARTQFSSSGVIIEKRKKSSSDVIRKSSNSRILE